MRNKKRNNQSGAILVMVAIVLAVTVLLAGFLWRRVGHFFYNEGQAHLKEEVLAITEGGLDKAIWALNDDENYTGETASSLGDGEFTIAVTDIDATTRRIVVTGYIPTVSDPIVSKTIEIEAIRTGSIINFQYGMQAGNGGLILENNNDIEGSVYANGNIFAGNNSTLSNDVWVAGSSNTVVDAQFETNNSEFQFGHTSSIRDVAQSFVALSTGTVSEVEVLLRKVGSPANLTVRIATNSGSVPGTTILASGTLNSSWVTSTQQWVRVALNANPTLTAGQKYWIILDGGSNASNYYFWGGDSGLGYAGNNAAYSRNWANQPWSTINTRDLNFRVYYGGVSTYFQGSSGVTVAGNLYAHHIDTVSVAGGAYYQTINNVVASSYHPGSTDPVSLPFPISQAQIDDWKSQAEAGGVYSGDYTDCTGSIGPSKIEGDFHLLNNCTVTITGTVWITGDMTLDNSNIVQLDSGYGGNGGVIIVSGKILLNNGNELLGSGQGDSYMLTISEYDGVDVNDAAIELNNNNIAEGIVYAGNGSVILNNSSDILEITGETIVLKNNIDIVYESGLANAFFSGSSNTFWVMRDGTWQEWF